MIVGFTGTRKGMTILQKENFKVIISASKISEFHHGDCVGADEDAHHIAAKILPEGHDDIIIHPGPSEDLRAYCDGKIIHNIKIHFKRNREIVDGCDRLIATPATMNEQSYGGTWYTINYARKSKKRIIIIWPNGVMTSEN